MASPINTVNTNFQFAQQALQQAAQSEQQIANVIAQSLSQGPQATGPLDNAANSSPAPTSGARGSILNILV